MKNNREEEERRATGGRRNRDWAGTCYISTKWLKSKDARSFAKSSIRHFFSAITEKSYYLAKQVTQLNKKHL